MQRSRIWCNPSLPARKEVQEGDWNSQLLVPPFRNVNETAHACDGIYVGVVSKSAFGRSYNDFALRVGEVEKIRPIVDELAREFLVRPQGLRTGIKEWIRAKRRPAGGKEIWTWRTEEVGVLAIPMAATSTSSPIFEELAGDPFRVACVKAASSYAIASG
jgi:hypothetical protein